MTALINLADDDLLRLVASGSEPAFTTLYRRRQGAVYRFAIQMSGSASIAEDVTQEVFLMLLRDPGTFDARRGRLASYLYGITRRLVWRRIAQLRAHQPIFDGEDENARTPESLVARPDVEGGLIHDEAMRSLRRAILALPAGYREAVILCELHELSYAEAARVLGCPVGTVRSRLHRARTLLAERLAVGKSSSSGCLV